MSLTVTDISVDVREKWLDILVEAFDVDSEVIVPLTSWYENIQQPVDPLSFRTFSLSYRELDDAVRALQGAIIATAEGRNPLGISKVWRRDWVDSNKDVDESADRVFLLELSKYLLWDDYASEIDAIARGLLDEMTDNDIRAGVVRNIDAMIDALRESSVSYLTNTKDDGELMADYIVLWLKSVLTARSPFDKAVYGAGLLALSDMPIDRALYDLKSYTEINNTGMSIYLPALVSTSARTVKRMFALGGPFYTTEINNSNVVKVSKYVPAEIDTSEQLVAQEAQLRDVISSMPYGVMTGGATYVARTIASDGGERSDA